MQNISDKADSTVGTTGELTALEYNNHKNELQGAVTRSGQSLSSSLLLQLAKAMLINGTGAGSCIDSGLGDSIILSPHTGSSGLVVPDNYAELDGSILSFTKNSVNISTAVTVNFGQTGTELGTKSLVRTDGSVVAAGDVIGQCLIRWDNTADNWVLISNETDTYKYPVSSSGSIVTPKFSRNLIEVDASSSEISVSLADGIFIGQETILYVSGDYTVSYNGNGFNVNNITSKYGACKATWTGDCWIVENISSNSLNINKLPRFGSYEIKVQDYATWQGIATDGTYIYTVSDRTPGFLLQNTITKLDMSGNIIEVKSNAYTETCPLGYFMSFGDATIISPEDSYVVSATPGITGYLYVTAYNANDGAPVADYASDVVVYSLPDMELVDHQSIGGNLAEGIVFKDDLFWVCYDDIESIKTFDIYFALQNTYTVSGSMPISHGAQGLRWIDDELYLNIHQSSTNTYKGDDNREMRVYTFDGSAFTYDRSYIPPTFGCYQGFDVLEYENGLLWFFADRPGSRIIVSSSVSNKNVFALTGAQGHSMVIIPTLVNSWELYDNRRTLKAWRDCMGYVHLEGIIKNGTLIPDMAFQLPSDWAPDESLTFGTTSNDAFCAVSVTGRINLEGVTPEADWGRVLVRVGSNLSVSLSGIYWRVGNINHADAGAY